MHNGIAEMAAQVRTELKDLSSDLHTGGKIFRKESKGRRRRGDSFVARFVRSAPMP